MEPFFIKILNLKIRSNNSLLFPFLGPSGLAVKWICAKLATVRRFGACWWWLCAVVGCGFLLIWASSGVCLAGIMEEIQVVYGGLSGGWWLGWLWVGLCVVEISSKRDYCLDLGRVQSKTLSKRISLSHLQAKRNWRYTCCQALWGSPSSSSHHLCLKFFLKYWPITTHIWSPSLRCQQRMV